MSYLWTSEAISSGHPDKVADQVADAVLDLVLSNDPSAKVAVEAVVTRHNEEDIVILTGEIGSNRYWPSDADLKETIRQVLYSIRYWEHPDLIQYDTGFSDAHFSLRNFLRKQSVEIAAAVDADAEIGAGDQGLMFGYASDEAPGFIPLAHWLSRDLVQQIEADIQANTHDSHGGQWESFFFPDAKSQVTLQYDDDGRPERVEAVVISACHRPNVAVEDVRKKLEGFIAKLPARSGGYGDAIHNLFDGDTKFILNPSGAWNLGGPASDTGLSGRKIVADQYGPYCPIGGGSFSGKDPTKVDRSAAYAARWLAKNIVAAGIAGEAQVQLSYAIGVSEPMSVRVSLDRLTGNPERPRYELERVLTGYIMESVSLTPKAIIERFGLRKPPFFYANTARYGHFGDWPTGTTLPWEDTSEFSDQLLTAVQPVRD
jgi:S-adenosylmethionine synthetase